MSFSKEWHALGREAELAGEQIASGITALGRANHAQIGLYTQAFFGLSIGIERLAKLIIVAEHAIGNAGVFPTNQLLRDKGHDISMLLNHCEPISEKYRSGKDYAARPSEMIHQGVVQTLTDFAKLSRYYNLDLITGSGSAQLPEPIGAWWQRVGQPILLSIIARGKEHAMRKKQLSSGTGWQTLRLWFTLQKRVTILTPLKKRCFEAAQPI